MVRRFGQWMTGALVAWALLLGLAWFTSESEPVCEGVLILETDDSDPPQCPSLLDGLFEVGPILLAMCLFIGWVGFLVATGVAQRREQAAA